MLRCSAVAAALLCCTTWASAVSTTPVHQVISMLNEMKGKGVKAMKVEEMIMAEYTKWVDDKVTELGFEIKTATSDIEKLVAFIEKADSDVSHLGSVIQELDAEIAEMDSSKAAAKKQREEEHAEFLKEQQDFAESVDALQRAIQVLKSQNFDRPQAYAMLQKMAKKEAAMRKVLAFVEMQQKDDQDGAPAVAAYEFQSAGIIDLLEKLLDKFKGQLSEVETGEANSAHAHDMAMLHATNTMEALNADRDEQAARKGKVAAESANAKGELSALKTDLAEDKKVLADTEAVYATKKSTFETNQKVRKEELEAIDKAIEIISDPSVAGSYSKHVNDAAAAVQLSAKPVKLHAASFLQEKSQRASMRAVAVNRAVEFLRSKAEATKSQVLSAFVAQAADNPFGKVIQMIEELLMKLKEEAAAEADHKAWCDKELHDNKLKREEHSSAVDRLMAEVEQLGSQIQSMSDEIATLAKEQAELTTAMSEATTTRTDEKATNEATIKDAVQAQEAVKAALVVLQEFYSKQGGAFLQHKKQVPEMAAYKGMQSAKGGVVGMLEVIQADFSRLETDTRAAENAAAQQYATFMSESKASKKAKHDREFKLKMDVDEVEFQQAQTKKDLTAEEEGLAAANKYYEDLKPSCVVVKVSFEERSARRKEEIEALKEAYKILDDHSMSQ